MAGARQPKQHVSYEEQALTLHRTGWLELARPNVKKMYKPKRPKSEAERRSAALSNVRRNLEPRRFQALALLTKKAVASWLDWNGLRLTRKIRIPSAARRPRHSS